MTARARGPAHERHPRGHRPGTLRGDIYDPTFATPSGGFSLRGTWVGAMPCAGDFLLPLEYTG
jgi:hypothetical protein